MQRITKIEHPEAEAVRTTLKEWMPTIQQILQQGGTSPTDFTLHDAQHGFRVAERMVDLIPDEVLPHLSLYELALLLFSAYLHDFGMSPQQSFITPHYYYLLSGNPNGLRDEQVDAFHAWLDDWGDDGAIPLAEGTPTSATLSRATFLTAHYIRTRHVDSGEQWMSEHLDGERLGTYAQWLSDLKALCRSHQGYNELIKDHFEPDPLPVRPGCHLLAPL